MHILDLIMYIVFLILFRILGDDSIEENFVFWIIYSVIYIILFVAIDYNWIDIFRGIYDIIINLQL